MNKASKTLDSISGMLQSRGLNKYAFDLDVVANTADSSVSKNFMRALKEHNDFIALYRRHVGMVPYDLQDALRWIMRSYLHGKIDRHNIKKNQRNVKDFLDNQVIEEDVLKKLLKNKLINNVL
jgi:hypothetical protein